MKPIFFLLFTLALLPLEAAPAIVPSPAGLEHKRSAPFLLKRGSKIFYEQREAPRALEKSLLPMAEVLSGELELVTGIRPAALPISENQKPKLGDIVLRFQQIEGNFAADESQEEQSYSLSVRSKGIIIEAPYTKGVSYGTASLIQAILEEGGSFKIPAMSIQDKPAAEYRAIMLDVARQPHSIGVIKDLVRLARHSKMRYVQLHLTDDQLFTFPFKPIVSKLEKNHFYTREELVDLVSYADARGVTLIPELDLPGHTRRLIQSGYLPGANNHADVADPKNFKKIFAIIDDINSIFRSSPYFHIGGDESGAGSKLVPFLSAVNKHLRSRPEADKKRMLVWEGFHGSPTKELPAKGEDRIIVMSWESSYNAPWDLLESGYTIINASWKPTYVCGGGGGFVHPGNTSGRRFSLEDMFRWDSTYFMHWEPGRPIYDDKGPKDREKDGEWDASVLKRDDQILGGMMLHWEQAERGVIDSLHERALVISQRMWNPGKYASWEDFEPVMKKALERVMTIVQPVVILPKKNPAFDPINDYFRHYEGEEIELTLLNRTKLPGIVRYTSKPMSGNIGGFRFPDSGYPEKGSRAADQPIKMKGGFSIAAQLFRQNGDPIEGISWAFFNNWPMKVDIVEYDVGRYTKQQVPDFSKFKDDKIIGRHQLPMIRGPLRNVYIRGQMVTTILTMPKDGDYTLLAKTQNGHASVYLDLNQNGRWEKDEKLISDTPKTEVWQSGREIKLKGGEDYLLRIDHNTGIPRPILGLGIEGTGFKKRTGLQDFIRLPK